jgi:hypothetical protein
MPVSQKLNSKFIPIFFYSSGEVHHDKTYATQGLDQFQVKTFLDPD